MGFIIEPVPEAEDINALKAILAHIDDGDFVPLLLKSLNQANDLARDLEKGLDPLLYKALPLEGMNGWPITFDGYVQYLRLFSRWIPHQSDNPAWVDPSDRQEHQEVYDYLCWFYWLIDQPLEELNGGVLQDIPWFSEFLVLWAADWGMFLNSDESFNDEVLNSFITDSPEYRVQDSMIPEVHNPEKLRPNDPSGCWFSFNQFFARELNPGLRPISKLAHNKIITAPADCTYKKHYEIDDKGRIEPPIVIKGTHTYATVQQLLDKSEYADAFNGGHFIHFFLGPNSYHRFHTPVAGKVKECYPLTGQVYLKVSLSGHQFDAADSSRDGYEFLQARGILTIDTTDSDYGDVGIVAVIPVGMCQVSGVNMTHVIDAECNKGDEFGYFTFGGSDIIVLMQKGTDPQWNTNFVKGTDYYSLYGTELASVTKLGDKP
ncbi:MAG: phosphatidylserine decarboxylase [Flavobacteriales bacterium]|jgi:phosphatidylserine decarboxylase